MSDAALETLALWLIIPAVVILAALGVISYGISPRRVRTGRRDKQVLRLRSEFQGMAANQGTPEINWLDYKDLTKAELKDIAAEHSLQYMDQEITSAGWLVRFSTAQSNGL